MDKGFYGVRFKDKWGFVKTVGTDSYEDAVVETYQTYLNPENATDVQVVRLGVWTPKGITRYKDPVVVT